MVGACHVFRGLLGPLDFGNFPLSYCCRCSYQVQLSVLCHVGLTSKSAAHGGVQYTVVSQGPHPLLRKFCLLVMFAAAHLCITLLLYMLLCGAVRSAILRYVRVEVFSLWWEGSGYKIPWHHSCGGMLLLAVAHMQTLQGALHYCLQ